MYEAGLIAVAAALVLLIKIPAHWIRRLLWLDIYLDVLVTMGFASILYGTYSGMTAALVAGLMFSVVLWITKQIMGHERLVFRRQRYRLHAYWEQVPGHWHKPV